MCLWVDSPLDHLHGIMMTMTIKLWVNKILQFVLMTSGMHSGFNSLSGLLTTVIISILQWIQIQQLFCGCVSRSANRTSFKLFELG